MERPFISHIVNKEYAHCTTVVSRSDGTEAFLAGRVPDLQLDSLAIQFNCTDLEINANGGDERGSERVFTKAEETTRLAHA